MTEKVLTLGEQESLFGVLTEPGPRHARADLPTVLFLNSGILHRVGPNRLYVKLARDLAALGFPSLRFDFSGIGDSKSHGGEAEMLVRWAAETRQAMDLLRGVRGSTRFILSGNCSGATIAFLTAADDERVDGAILVNRQGDRMARYFVRLALKNPKIWKRLARGAVDLVGARKAISSRLGKTERTNTVRSLDPLAMLSTIIDRGADLLFVYCEWDPGLDYYRARLRRKVAPYLASGKMQVETIPKTNHDFNLLVGQRELQRIVYEWAARVAQR